MTPLEQLLLAELEKMTTCYTMALIRVGMEDRDIAELPQVKSALELIAEARGK